MFKEPHNLAHKCLIAFQLDINSDQIGMKTMREPPGITNNGAALRARIETDQHMLCCRPLRIYSVIAHIFLELRFRLLSRTTQRKFTQSGQVPLTKEIIERWLDALWRIDIAVLHTLP